MTIQLNTDVIGTIGGYLAPPTTTKDLQQRVDAVLQMIELVYVTKAPVKRTIAAIKHQWGNAEVQQQDKLADKIGVLAYLAGAGRFQTVNRLLQDPDISHPPCIGQSLLKTQTSVYKLPCYIAFKKATELAVIKNQPEMLNFLLKHDQFRSLFKADLPMQPLSNWIKDQPNHLTSRAASQNLLTYFESRDAHRQIIEEAAVKSVALDKLACLKTLYASPRGQEILSIHISVPLQTARAMNRGDYEDLILSNCNIDDQP